MLIFCFWVIQGCHASGKSWLLMYVKILFLGYTGLIYVKILFLGYTGLSCIREKSGKFKFFARSGNFANYMY